MILGCLYVGVLLLCAIISSGTNDRTRTASVLLAIAASALVPVTIGCVCSRGSSTSSLVLLSAALFLTAAAAFALRGFAVARFTDGEPDSGGLIIRWRRHKSEAVIFRSCVAWLIVAMVFVVSPLRYAGALNHDGVDVGIGTFLTGSNFDPLSERRRVAVGQCLDSREVDAENDVVPCSVRHQAQVIDRVLRNSLCPGDDEFENTGLGLEVASSAEIDGFVYCFLQKADSDRGWQGRITRDGELPDTL